MAESDNSRPLRLSPDSRVFLSDGAYLDATGISDKIAGSRYELNTTAVDALKLLAQGLTLTKTSMLLAKTRAVPAQIIFTDLARLLTSLDAFDLIVVKQVPLSRRLKSLLLHYRYLFRPMAALVAVQTFLDDDRKRAPARRYSATLAGIILAAARAMRYVIIAGCVLIPLMLACSYGIAGTASGVSLSRYGVDLGRPILITIIFVTASVIHELAHLLVLKMNSVKVHYISARTSVIAIRHAMVSPVLNGAVAIAGPAVACGFCIAVTAITSFYHTDLGVGVNGVNPFIVIGVLNLLTLNPWSTDGRALWRALMTLIGKR